MSGDRMGLELAVYGSSLLSSYWNGAATYYRGLFRELSRLGVRITFFEPDAWQRQEHRDIEEPEWARVVVYPATEGGVSDVLGQANGAGMLIKCSGVGVFDDVLEAGVVERARKTGARVAFWDVDAPATLERLEQNPADPFARLIPEYDYVFTYGGGEPVVNAYRSHGARECVPVYNALDPATHHPAEADPRFAADVSLLANRLPDREARIEEFFFRPARLLPNRRFLLAGNGWHDKELPPNVTAIGHLPTKDHNAFNASATAVLNVNRDSMARFGFSPATRVFEAAGAGACLITDAFEGVEEFFEPGEEILVARDGQEVAWLVEALTAERARGIGASARRRALAEHTYQQRAELWRQVTQ